MSIALLVVLALLDGAFAGFRDASGRNPLLHKSRYMTRAMVKGTLMASGAVCVIGVVVAIALFLAADPAGLYQDLSEVAGRMLWVYAIYAGIALAALVGFSSPKPETSALVTVLVLGPFTLFRPVVIVAGAFYGVWAVPSPATFACAGAAAVAMASLEPLMARLGLNPRDLEAQIRLR